MRMLIARLACLAAAFAMASVCTGAAEPSGPTVAPANRYTFSWPLYADTPAPRGGSTRGAAVTVDTTASDAWRALHEPSLRPLDRDRRAILAIAGDYRATFDFLAIATYTPGAARDRPYQSWGTERVYVDQDRERFISLVHILELRTVDENGKVSEPIVQKHWREDWQFEPTQLIEFKGEDCWAQRALSAGERRGQWSQTVAQTDESPRYASLGHWEHSGDASTWISGDTWRPLPRRESRRKDYQVLLGTNRVTVTATGWLQEENNLKAVLTPQHTLDAAHPYLAREYGVARYERLRDADFAAATQYFERTQAFWDQVHSAWQDLFQHNARVNLREPSDPDAGPYGKLFEYADQLASGHAPDVPASTLIKNALREVVAPVQADLRRASPTTVAGVPSPGEPGR